MTIRYIARDGNAFTTDLRTNNGNVELLWGDPCHIVEDRGNNTLVRARGRIGTVPTRRLTRESILEAYVIDVGQGDAVLLKTPDRRWHLIDGGVSASRQMTRKGAANFLRWKFMTDLRRRRIDLHSIILTHPDFDHYGGLIDVLSGTVPAAGTRPQQTFPVNVDNFYHPGMGRFAGRNPLGERDTGTVDPFPQGNHGIRRRGSFITELLSGKTSFRRPSRPFRGAFADLARLVGRVPGRVARLDASDRFVPGYDATNDTCQMHVLGPIIERCDNGTVGMRWLSNESQTRNGHSIVLRIDYGDMRMLLTGDLNTLSQRLLLSYQAEADFQVDVAKGCHHGSDDIDIQFVRAMGARATVISSGDNEDYAHPRPRVLGASARFGRDAVDERGDPLPPLLYSTELSRSVKLQYADRFEVDFEDGGQDWTVSARPNDVRYRLRSGTPFRSAGQSPFATDLVYGLVNVRTDGTHIMLATLEEKGNEFDYRVVRAGQSPRS